MEIQLNPRREMLAVGPASHNGKRREREVIRLDTEKAIRQVMAAVGCDREAAKKIVGKEVRLLTGCDWKTAPVVVERGYYVVDYKKKTRHLPEEGAFDHKAAYRMAGFVYKRKFEGRLPWYIDPEDLVQEAVIRIYEMSGHPESQEKKYRFYLALNAMRGFLERQGRLRSSVEPGYKESCREEKASPDTWGRSHRATENMCRIIEAKGITPRELAA